MLKKIFLGIILIIVFCYMFTYKIVFEKKSNIKISIDDNKYRIYVTTSDSYAKWGHSYYVENDSIYLNIYLYPFYNFFVNNNGTTYVFYIDESVNKFNNIYIINQLGTPELIYYSK